ncbi:MFS transporter [Deinococcus cellulosilyticus]|uniref:Tetracycline resistance MFS efflux pump n=1 Tax=Deinococcus cellulosilyticus (strain DSM 18568 / NBRC 106333 / KACC 11606 / 5516J-15) TaxID=1223518 RepID=A0A511N5C6_DEIC1|nr:MFS transporter [Deinococcus cellulosilyticus]GEM47636.1 tetracycline resistance MFS efflux pump [Deinococcus cellulosilyticus NBRC 106333 = KACC 11606]
MTDPQHTSPRHRHALLFLFISAFLGSLGFTLVAPVLPFLVSRYITDQNQLAVTIGWLTISYSLCSFFAAPVLGALSDRYGRRPVLLLSLLGSAIGYLIFGWGGALWVLFLGRIIDGLTAGNFSAIFGYLADVTKPEERGKYFGIMGAVFGSGFIIGPAVGGLASHISLEAPFYLAAAVTFLNVLWGFFFLPESHRKEHRVDIHFKQLNPFTQIAGLFQIPSIRMLLIAGVLFMIPFVMMQTTFAVLVKDTLHWGPDQTSLAFVMVGISDIVVQGLLLGLMIRLMGESGVALLGLTLSLLSLVGIALLPWYPSGWLVYVSITAFAIGEGVFGASLGSLTSKAAGPTAQGRVQGGSQALNALSQVVSPGLAGQLYSRVGHSAPYWTGAVMVLLGALALGTQLGSKTLVQTEASET